MITIVMPTYNQGKFIAEAIDSILAQTFRLNSNHRRHNQPYLSSRQAVSLAGGESD